MSRPIRNKPLLGKNVAVLVANGFLEQDVTSVQRHLHPLGATIRMVSMEDHGLAHSWNGTGWGLHFAGDAVLKSALAVDYSMLVVPGGQRSIEKLKLTAHTKRFIGGFISMHKPVAVLGDALSVLTDLDLADGLTVSGPQSLNLNAQKAGAHWVEDDISICDHVITANVTETSRETVMAAVSGHFVNIHSLLESDENHLHRSRAA